MPRGPPVVPIIFSDEEKTRLLSIARSRSLPHEVVQRWFELLELELQS